MTIDVHIPLVDRRYRLNGAPKTLCNRLNALTETLLRDNLPDILRANGVPSDTICLRHLSLRLGYRPGQSEAACLAEWSAALGKAVNAALGQSGHDSLVRLGGPVSAHLDIAEGLAAGRLERAWAWKAAGLTQGDHYSPLITLATDWQAKLANDPMLPAVLRALMRTGLVSRLQRVGLLSPSAQAYLGHALLAQLGHSALESLPLPSAPPTSETDRIIPALVPLLSADVSDAPRTDRAAIAVWSVAAAEPAALMKPPATLRAILYALGDRLARPAVASLQNAEQTGRPSAEVGSLQPDRRSSLPQPDPLQIAATHPAELPGSLANSSGSEQISIKPVAKPKSAPESARTQHGATPSLQPSGPVGAPAGTTDKLYPPHVPQPTEQSEPGPDTLAALRSRYAGLVLWLNAFANSDSIDALANDPELKTRPFGWRMAKLVQTLVPVGDYDPALMVLSDRMPEDLPWSETEAPATKQEKAAIAEHARRFAKTLSLLLPERDPTTLPLALAAQRGRIDHTPGWITFALPLDQVATDLRAAGLDLHPGFVTWLGAVVRIEFEEAP